jgi:hypothetical protein
MRIKKYKSKIFHTTICITMERDDMNYRQGRTRQHEKSNEKLAMIGVASLLVALVITIVVKAFK